MQKTRLGISVGMLGAAIYLTGLFSGYLVAVLLAGYVLMFEENEWLRRTGVKAVSLMVLFSLITVLVNLLPDIMSCISNVSYAFGGNYRAEVISNLGSALTGAVKIVESLVFIVLAIEALTGAHK